MKRRGWSDRLCLALIGGAAVLLPALSQAQIVVADYDSVSAELGGSFGFESFEARPEPGLQIDGVILAPALSIGKRFEGQRPERAFADKPYERLTPPDPVALNILPGVPGRNLSIAFHRGFGSNALLPIGIEGFDRIDGRGEGVTAIRFLEPQPAFGFRVHADYADPLGSRPAPGQILVRVFDPEGRPLAVLPVDLDYGVLSLAWRSTGAPIGGLTITPVDPGGIALDDILFALTPLTG